ncbi:MAG: M20/M25/M40 family metallo-hydrolase [Anaerolineales bacterium]|nr:M20/M25/M40 family metallo-hydrolase [Anaerolineales bacterium]
MDDKLLAAHLKDLVRAPGLSAFEAPVRAVIAAAWRRYAPKQTVSRLGSLHALLPGTSRGNRPKILLTAHMDKIGLMVTQVIDGFCRLTEIGGVDPRILPGQFFTIHGREAVPAVAVLPPAALLPPDRKTETARLKDLWLDTGLPAADAARLIRTGDPVSFRQEPLDLADGRFAGPALDDRASVAALTVCLEDLAARPHRWDVIAAATVQEEETLGGAYTSAFALKPDLAVAVDVTFAAGPGLPEHKTFPIGEGPTIGWGPNAHPGLCRAFRQAAERAGIKYALEIMSQHSGTDAYAMQTAGEGIPTAVIGIPLRYMHSAVETAALADIRQTGLLLAETAASLGDNFLDALTWE